MNHPNVVRVLDQIKIKRKRGREGGGGARSKRGRMEIDGAEHAHDEAEDNDKIDSDHEEDPTMQPECHLVLELVTGGDLFSYYEKSDGLGEDEMRWFAWQMVKALDYLHGQKVAHRGKLCRTHRTRDSYS